jgi:protein-tyrosine phosphatase
MKYGLAFLTLALLLVSSVATNGGIAWLLVYPASRFAVVGVAYLTDRHEFFGKRLDGRLAPLAVLILLPYLVYVWSIWHLVRLLSREPAISRIDDELLIGRRLLNKELPAGVLTVVDLTSEFVESRCLRSVRNYVSFPILDASTRSASEIAELATGVAVLDAPIFIHCAQGHGRTGLIAAAVLLASGKTDSIDQAVSRLEQARPLLKLGRIQRKRLAEVHARLQQKHLVAGNPRTDLPHGVC